MLFGSTSRRFGTISIFPSIPIATYRIMLLLRKVVQVQMPSESTCRSRSASLPADRLDRRPVTFQVMPLHHVERGQQVTDQRQDRPQQRALIGRD